MAIMVVAVIHASRLKPTTTGVIETSGHLGGDIRRAEQLELSVTRVLELLDAMPQ